MFDEVFVVILSIKRALSRHLRAVTLAVALSIVFGLFVLGAQKFAVNLVPSPWDKLAHTCVFAVLAVAIGLSSGLRGWRVLLLAFASVLLVGVLDEWHQVYLPGRQAGWGDLAADAVGGLIGALVLSLGVGRQSSR